MHQKPHAPEAMQKKTKLITALFVVAGVNGTMLFLPALHTASDAQPAALSNVASNAGRTDACERRCAETDSAEPTAREAARGAGLGLGE